jgi:DNA-binding response OmpR family regulator
MTSDAQRTKKLILVVDDESDVRTILRAILTQSGYSIVEARDGQEALDLLVEMRFDLMILDLLMPRVNGEEVLQRLDKERLKTMPVIILTAKTSKRAVERGYRKGASFYVIKPFSNTTIVELVRYLVEDMTEKEREKILSSLLK